MKKKQDEKAKQKNSVEAQESPAEKEKPEADQPQEKPGEQPAQEEKQEKPPQPEDEASDDAQAEENGEGAEPEQEAPEAEETPAEDEQAVSAANGGDENAKLRADLLTANSKLAAYTAGVRQDMIDDAVILATAQAQAAGEVTEEAVTAAMTEVLKRHPEWKAEVSDKKKSGGFKLGADPDTSTTKKTTKTQSGSEKRWNRFK